MARQEQNKDYWEERIKQEQAYMQRATDVGALGEHFERAIDDIQQKIDHEYARLEKLGFNKNVVEDADIKAYGREAKQLVKEADNIRASLGRNAKKSDFTQAVNDRMTVYNATMRINRLEYLKSETALSLTKAGVNTVGDMQKELTKKYMNERKRQSGILGETIRPASADKVFKQAMAQTDGATFSDRIWRNTDELKAQLDVLLTNNQIQGQNPKVIAQRLRSFVSEQFADKAKYVTERIARTESTRMIGAAQLDSYREAGLEYTKWIAEASACDFCEDIAHGGKNGEGIYKLDKVPAYPRHSNCRCSLAGYYNPDEDVKKSAKEEKNTQSVPDFENEEMRKTFGDKNYKMFLDKINSPDFDPRLRAVYNKYSNEYKFNYIGSRGASQFTTINSKINLDGRAWSGSDINEPLQTVFHEMGHAVDFKALKEFHGSQLVNTGRKIKTKILGKTREIDERVSQISSSPDYGIGKVIHDDFEKAIYGDLPELPEKKPRRGTKKREEYDDLAQKRYDAGHNFYLKYDKLAKVDEHSEKLYSDFSDMVEATGHFGNQPFNVGHGLKYWETPGNRETEFFAEMSSMLATNKEAFDMVSELLPNATKAYYDLLEQIASRGN